MLILPTYLPSNPYPTLAFPTLRSPCIPSPIPTLLYHIHPDQSRGRNVSFPTITLTFPYSTLPSLTVPTPPTLRFPSTSYLSTLLPLHPIHSAHLPCPNTYPAVPSLPLPSPPISSLLPPPLIPSPGSHLHRSTQLYPKMF